MRERPARTGRPRFTGVTTFSDRQGRYEFRHPSDWFRTGLDGDLDGVITGPDPDDDATHFAVVVTDLGVAVTAADLDLLRDGFDRGIAELADVVIESSSENTYNDIVKVERTLTFSDQGETRKRRVWSMYADHWQFTVLFQGATVEEYAYWLPMGNYCFTAFQLPLALWFATDPSVSAAQPG
ncbi:MAG TPA: hypothetical protein VFU98_18040 [Microlunatus sp.]|nr:hypothetical protein [Microlunatus sp.]